MATAYDTANIIIPKSAGYKSGVLQAWNPQTSSLVDFAVTRTGATATRVNQSGVREAVAANVPRIDWAEGLSCPSLLVEPQRTNIFPQDLSGSGVVTRTINVANATVYSVSVEGTGSMALSGAGTGTVSEGSPITFTSSSTSLTLTLTGSLDYCQVEAGAYPTSIIFTELVQETRNVDTIKKTGIGSLLNDLEGVLFLEFKCFQGGTRFNGIELFGNSDNRVAIYQDLNDEVEAGIISNGVNITPTTPFNSGYDYVKAAISYKSGDIRFYCNGNPVYTDTDTFTFAVPLTAVNFSLAGAIRFEGRLRIASVYDYMFTASELASLTTP